ncbi:MAG: cytochrome b/b6 domain-containing protein [Caldilineaceae bacterium]
MTMAGVALHGGLCVGGGARNPHPTPALEKVYMYTIYERLWHWLQTSAILLLIFTGLIIHKPDIFGIFQFKYAVQVHNILAVVLVINATLAAFYHIVSGEIRQYLPGRWASSTRPSPRPSSIWAAFSRGTSIPLTRIRATS